MLRGRLSRGFCPRLVRAGRRRRLICALFLDAIFYLLRTGCQWRLLPRDFPAWGTVLPLLPNMEEQRRDLRATRDL
jgi:transposase